MFASAVVYAGLLVAFVGTIAVLKPLRFLRIRTRRAGAMVVLLGLAAVLVAWSMPARATRIVPPRTQLDRYMPAYQFHERHVLRMSASPERVDRAIRAVTADEIALFRLLTGIRRLGLPGSAGILNPPEKMPLLEVAQRSGFLRLSDQPRREIVFGTAVVTPPGWRPRGRPTPEGFRTLHEPGFALAAMNFRIEPDRAGGSLVTTETRIYATDATAARRFARYWRVIYPGSWIIRRMWLEAIRVRSES